MLGIKRAQFLIIMLTRLVDDVLELMRAVAEASPSWDGELEARDRWNCNDLVRD